jgi:hypothetical protein
MDPAVGSTMTVAGIAFACLVVIVVLYAIRRRLRTSPGDTLTDAREKSDTTSAAPAGLADPSVDFSDEAVGLKLESCAPLTTSSKAERELDLQLLRFLSEETSGGLSRQIDLYLSAFESDRCRARAIFATRDPRQIHRLAHRLIAHAAAVHCVPLHTLASTMQAESAQLRPREFEQLMTAFDREFAVLRKRLDALRGSTGLA